MSKSLYDELVEKYGEENIAKMMKVSIDTSTTIECGDTNKI